MKRRKKNEEKITNAAVSYIRLILLIISFMSLKEMKVV